MIMVFWGFALLASAMIANKIALVCLPPLLFVALRMFGAGAILIAYFWGKTNRIQWSYFKKDLYLLLGISLLTTLVPSIFKAYALKHMIAAKFSLFGSLDPFITAFYAYILWREKLNFQKIIGMLIALSGLIVLVMGTTSEEGLLVFNLLSYPELAALAAPLLGRLGWMMVQYLVRAERYTAAEINGLTMLLSGLAAFCISYPTEPWNISCGSQSFQVAAALLYTIVVGNIIALTIYGNLLKTHTSTFVSLAGFSINIFVALYGWILLGEVPSWHFFAAAGLMFTGLFVFSLAELKKSFF